MVKLSGSAVRQILRMTIVLLGVHAGVFATAQQIAITFDDLPAHNLLPPGETRMQVATAVIKALHDAGAPPTYGFVNGQAIEREPADATVLDAWRKAGNPLGNHAWSHMNLSTNSLEDWEKDVLRNEATISNRMQGQDWHWLRFPFLSVGDTEAKRAGVRTFLGQHGYKIAGVTMSFGDYLWNEHYARCSEKKDAEAISFLEASYLLAAKSELHYARTLSHALYGRDIPYVLLMHIGAFDAHMLPRLLRLYKAEGVTFISLEEAEKDPFYHEDTELTMAPGPDSLQGVMQERHLPLPKRSFDPPKMDDLCR